MYWFLIEFFIYNITIIILGYQTWFHLHLQLSPTSILSQSLTHQIPHRYLRAVISKAAQAIIIIREQIRGINPINYHHSWHLKLQNIIHLVYYVNLDSSNPLSIHHLTLTLWLYEWTSCKYNSLIILNQF